jgi:hypothetical protein
MKNFNKSWANWVSRIKPKLNRKLLEVPTADLTKLFESKRTVEEDSIQPERLNPKTSNEWIDWENFTPPKDVRGIFIKFDSGQVWTDAHFYGSNEYKSKTIGNAKPIGWKFMQRSDPNKKSIQA